MLWDTFLPLASLPLAVPFPASCANCECLKFGGQSKRQRTAKAMRTAIDQLFWNQQEIWSGRGDLNARPPAPKAGALPGCATPRHINNLERVSFYCPPA